MFQGHHCNNKKILALDVSWKSTILYFLIDFSVSSQTSFGGPLHLANCALVWHDTSWLIWHRHWHNWQDCQFGSHPCMNAAHLIEMLCLTMPFVSMLGHRESRVICSIVSEGRYLWYSQIGQVWFSIPQDALCINISQSAIQCMAVFITLAGTKLHSNCLKLVYKLHLSALNEDSIQWSLILKSHFAYKMFLFVLF